MKLLVYLWNSYTDTNLCDILFQLNISYDKFTYNFDAQGHNKNEDEEFVYSFCKTYESIVYDAVISIDYWPPIALACYKLNIKYIAWSYDCPIDILKPEDTMCLPNVYTFLFDKVQAEGYLTLGLNHVYHMPLGANTKLWKNVGPGHPNCSKYKSEVSFVGKLYQNSSYNIISNLVSAKTKSILQTIIDTQRKLPQTYILDNVITESFVSLVDTEIHNNCPNFMDNVTVRSLRFALECEIARYDRLTLLNLSGKRYNTHFYTGEESELIQNVTIHPYVDYYDEMPYIFAAAKVNLNPTLMAIRSGVNLRTFDVTACGGFLLTNHQIELDDYFADGKELVIYDSIYDFIDKLEYYLSHENERAKIAMAGKARCIKDHGMDKRLSDIIKIVFT